MRRIKIGDRSVRLRDEGDSPRTPLVLIHGAATSSVVWMDAVRRLAPIRRVIAPDLPGHGQSDRWHDPAAGHAISIELYRDFIGTVCAESGIDRAILVGHSMGGLVALACAIAYPERVAGLVLAGTGARIKVARATYAFLERGYHELGGWFAQAGYSPATSRDLVDRWSAVLVQSEQEVAIGDFRAVERFDASDHLAGLDIPSLVMVGEDDLLTPPRLSHDLVRPLPNARLAAIPRAGHMLFHEQPDAFHAELGRYLGETQ